MVGWLYRVSVACVCSVVCRFISVVLGLCRLLIWCMGIPYFVLVFCSVVNATVISISSSRYCFLFVKLYK